MRFLHVADIHLDSPMRHLRRMDDESHDDLIRCTRRALVNLVQFAVDPTNAIDFIVIAGDVFDGEWRDFQTGLFFQKQMLQLKEAGIPVVAIRGNHDAQSKMIRDLTDWRDSIRFLDADRPQTLSARDLNLDCDVLIHGQSFREGAVPDNLAATYPAGDRGAFNLGLLHTSFAGFEGHDVYAPCALDDLKRKEYGYWALGHIHLRQSLDGAAEEEACIRYAGNLQGRHVKEEGPKGAIVVDVDARQQVTSQFIPFDVLRWKRLTVTVEPEWSRAKCLDAVEAAIKEAVAEREGRDLALRITLAGRSAAHGEFARDVEKATAEIAELAYYVEREALWIESVRIRTKGAYDRDKLARDDGPAGEIVRWFDEAADDGAFSLDDDALAQLLKKLPRDLRESSVAEDDADEFVSPERLKQLLPQAEALLLDAILGDGEAR
ncbi:MAG TPA: DNA repair exonuclease [Pirellulaceae bacterium]|jgi:DNA repair exonuclease SbcCD nuclease subunit|nr:DNA repair exonuclease [Pirellulaceae bacterium]